MSPLSLLGFATWTLFVESGACALKVDRVAEWCVNGVCAPVERVTAERPDRWVLAPSGTALRWTAPDTAELVCEGAPAVLRARLASKSAVDAPAVPFSSARSER